MGAKWADTSHPHEEASFPYCHDGLACARGPGINEDHIELIRENCPRCQGTGGQCLMSIIETEAARLRH